MQKTNPIVLSVLTVIVLMGTCVSLTQAQEISSPPSPDSAPDTATADSGDNSTSSDNQPVLYASDDNSTAPLIAPGPSDASGAEQQNLIAAQTDNTTLIGASAAVIVAAVGISVFVFFRYRARNKV
jgi:hypothetical protein